MLVKLIVLSAYFFALTFICKKVYDGPAGQMLQTRANLHVVNVLALFCDLCSRQGVMGDVVGKRRLAPAMADPICGTPPVS